MALHVWQNIGVDSLVGTNTSSLQCFRAQLFILVGDKMYAKWELVNVRPLAAEIEDSNLRIRYTAVESGFWIWLGDSC